MTSISLSLSVVKRSDSQFTVGQVGRAKESILVCLGPTQQQLLFESQLFEKVPFSKQTCTTHFPLNNRIDLSR